MDKEVKLLTQWINWCY